MFFEMVPYVLSYGGAFWELVGIVARFTIIPVVGGFGIGLAVSRGAILGKSRSVKTARVIAVLCSLIGIAVYAVLRHKLYWWKEASDSVIDITKVIGAFPSMAVGAGASAAWGIVEKPFL